MKPYRGGLRSHQKALGQMALVGLVLASLLASLSLLFGPGVWAGTLVLGWWAVSVWDPSWRVFPHQGRGTRLLTVDQLRREVATSNRRAAAVAQQGAVPWAQMNRLDRMAEVADALVREPFSDREVQRLADEWSSLQGSRRPILVVDAALARAGRRGERSVEVAVRLCDLIAGDIGSDVLDQRLEVLESEVHRSARVREDLAGVAATVRAARHLVDGDLAVLSVMVAAVRQSLVASQTAAADVVKVLLAERGRARHAGDSTMPGRWVDLEKERSRTMVEGIDSVLQVLAEDPGSGTGSALLKVVSVRTEDLPRMLVDKVDQVVEAVLSAWPLRDLLDPPATHTVVATATAYLPDALAAYRVGPTDKDRLLAEQLDTLVAAVRQAVDAAALVVAQTLVVGQAVLADKYGFDHEIEDRTVLP